MPPPQLSSGHERAIETRPPSGHRETSLEHRMKRLAADDMLSTDQAASLLGTSRVTINTWIAKGRAIGLAQIKRGKKMPRWQFEPTMWQILLTLSDALGTKDGWEILGFLEAPHEGLDGLAPRVAIESGKANQVLELAAGEFK